MASSITATPATSSAAPEESKENFYASSVDQIIHRISIIKVRESY
jgi:hypothetical protein